MVFYEYVASTTGQEKIVAYRYIKPWGMWVVPGVNKADYFDELRDNFLKWNVVCALVIMLLLSTASYWIIRSISGPIMSAVNVANHLATGILQSKPQALPPKRGGKLARSMKPSS